MANEKSCGAIVFTYVNDVRKYVIIRGTGAYQAYCGFPKGHMEAGETERETAIREVKEETGLDVVLYDEFRTVDEHMLVREGRPNDKKMNVYFLAEYRDQELCAQESEVSKIVLMDYNEAMCSIQYEESQRELTEAETFLNNMAESQAAPVNFDAFTKDIVSNKWNVFGAEIYENGNLTHSFGDTTENLHELFSATKTVLSLAVGIAYDEGVFELERCVLDYIPKTNLNKMSEKQRDSFGKITIHRLLTMSVGELPFRILSPEEVNWLDFSLSCEIKNPDEKVFNYSNIDSYLVGVALSNAIGMDLAEFIEKRLLQPLEIERYKYIRSHEGYFYGASGMEMTVHDLSKFGLLLMNKGIYKGKRIVSEKYVEMATSVQQMNREGGYGYFIWKYRDGFSINGRNKQKCYILPKRGIIVTYLSYIEDTGDDDLKRSMEKWILGLTETQKASV